MTESETKVRERLPFQWLLENAIKYNLEWLHNHPNHYLSETWRTMHGRSMQFASTCCEVTAMSIRARVGLGEEWIFVEGKSFEEMKQMYPVFQMTFCDDENDNELENHDEISHMVTVWFGEMIDSHYTHGHTPRHHPTFDFKYKYCYFWIPPIYLF